MDNYVRWLSDVLLRFVLSALLVAFGLVLAFGAGIHAVWAFAVAVVLGWVTLTAAVVMLGEAFPFWSSVATLSASFVVAGSMAVAYARMDDSSLFMRLAVAMALLAVTSLVGAGLSLRRTNGSEAADEACVT